VLNRQLSKTAVEVWSEDSIRIRTQELAAVIAQIWPVPPNHKSSVRSVQPRLRKKIDLPDLINGGALQPGMALFPRRKKYSHKVATLLQDGQVEVDGVAFSSASDAAAAIVGKKTNGWSFFLTDQASRRSLQRVRRDYVNAMAVDVEDDEPDDDGEEDEE
jgi:Restriction Enzyme Adenine Methylase Associated